MTGGDASKEGKQKSAGKSGQRPSDVLWLDLPGANRSTNHAGQEPSRCPCQTN
jgi:hypothetical protein